MGLLSALGFRAAGTQFGGVVADNLDGSIAVSDGLFEFILIVLDEVQALLPVRGSLVVGLLDFIDVVIHSRLINVPCL